MIVTDIRRVSPRHTIDMTIDCKTPLMDTWISGAKKAIRSVLAAQEIRTPVSVELIFVTEDTIQTLNRENRNKDAVTDVLSFPALPLRPGDQPDTAADAGDCTDGKIALGSIVICVDRALQQAREYGHSPRREFAFLAAHSTLHLLGYDHETSDEDEEEMFALQKKILLTANILR